MDNNQEKWVQPETTSFLQLSVYNEFEEKVTNINNAQLSWKAELNPKAVDMAMIQVKQKKKFDISGAPTKKKSEKIEVRKEFVDSKYLSNTDPESLIYY